MNQLLIDLLRVELTAAEAKLEEADRAHDDARAAEYTARADLDKAALRVDAVRKAIRALECTA